MGIKDLFSITKSGDGEINEEQLIALVHKRYKSQESVLQDYHRQWFVNIAMRRGLQYVQTKAGMIVMPPESDDRVRMIINRMIGIHQTRVAKIIKDMPKLEVIPASSQDEDKDLARKGTKLLSWLWSNERMVEKILKAVGWAVDVGNCFFYIYWDADKGTEIPIYKRHDGEITGKEPYVIDPEGFILDQNGQRIQEKLSMGDVAIDIVDPFCFCHDGVSTNLQDSQFVIIKQAMPLREIRKRWGERGGKVKAEKDLDTSAYYQKRLLTMVGNQNSYFTPEAKNPEPMCSVYSMFEKESDEYPNGRRVICAGGVILEAGDMPYEHKMYPLVHISDIDVSGSFWKVGTMENVIPVQKGFNRVISQIIENGNNFGNIKAWTTKGHGLGEDAYDDTGSEVLVLNEGHSLNQMQPASLPSHVIGQLEWFDKAFEDITGMHEVTNASAPAGVESGTAILALQEQDDTRLAPTKMLFFRNIEEIGYQALQLYAQFQEEDREYQIIGSNPGDMDEFKISKNDIRSMKKDVRVQTENIIGSHKRIQQEQILEMFDKGLFGDQGSPETKKKVLQLLEFGNAAEIFDEIDLDSAQARRENEAFINDEKLQTVPHPLEPGVMVRSLPAYEFEDHEVHINAHNKLRKSPRYRQMTEALRKGIDLHVKVHENFLGKHGAEPAPTPSAQPPSGMPPPPMGTDPMMGPPPPMGAGGPPPMGANPMMGPPPMDVGGPPPMMGAGGPPPPVPPPQGL